MCVPETTVERADTPDELNKRGRGRPRKLIKTRVVEPPTVLESERRVIIGEEAQTELLKEPDILADQRAMQCPEWVPDKTLTLSSSERRNL